MPVYVPGSLGPSTRTNLGPTKVATAAPYAVVGGTPAAANLLDNGDFEVNASSWGGYLNSTIARSTLQANTGTASLAITATAAGDMSATGFNLPAYSVPVVAGRDYVFTMAVRAGSVGRAIQAQINWLVGGTFLSASLVSSTDATTWSIQTVSGTAPPTADGVTVVFYIAGCGTGEVHYLDTVNFYAASVSGVAYFATLAATSTTIAGIAKDVAKTIIATSLTVPIVQKAISKALSATSTTVATLATFKALAGIAYYATLAATSTTVASIQKAAGKGLAVATLTVPALARSAGRRVVLSVASITVPSVRKAVGKSVVIVTVTVPALVTSAGRHAVLAATSITVAALATFKAHAGIAYYATLAATSTSIASIQKAIGKGLTVTSTTTPALRKAVSKGLSATSASVVSITKGVTKTLRATSLTAASLIAAKGSGAIAYFVTLAVTSTTVPTIRKVVGKGLSAVSTSTASIRKRIAKTLAATSLTVPSIQKAIAKTLAAVSLSVPTLATFKNATIIIHLALGKLISASGAGILRSRSGVGTLIARAGTGAIKTRSGIGWLISRSGLGNLRSK